MNDLLTGGRKRREMDGLVWTVCLIALLCFVVGFAIGHAT